ncbi:SRPBCC domain-containing protein [Mucilaginibacter sp. PAMB04168]|uniref:SRPBCC family protein n=1 Tax=Mucilaginibacter sp. PAMB04168 TaxID=3138567 RepID=UPI0031F6FEBD
MTQPYEIERVYRAPVNEVWVALTTYDQMKQWYFDLPGFKAEVGYTFTFLGGHENGIQYKHVCQITNVEENKKLSYTWRYEGYPGESEVSFELFPEGDGTRLKLTHKGLETFPANNPDFAASNFAAGWEHIIGASLKRFLELA